jgi:predicted kinase
MASTLILLGGPPAVGKSTVLALLPSRLDPCVCLDADDVHDPASETAAERAVPDNIAAVRGLLEAGEPRGVLGWVFGRQEMIDRVLAGVADLGPRTAVVHLVASRDVIEARFRARGGPEPKLAYALDRLARIDALPYPKIDTTGLAPEVVADRVAEHAAAL